MTNEELTSLLQSHFTSPLCQVTGDGYHFNARIVSDQFAGFSSVKRQQMVYAVVGQFIQSGELHAITIQTFTQEEWEQQHG